MQPSPKYVIKYGIKKKMGKLGVSILSVLDNTDWTR